MRRAIVLALLLSAVAFAGEKPPRVKLRWEGETTITLELPGGVVARCDREGVTLKDAKGVRVRKVATLHIVEPEKENAFPRFVHVPELGRELTKEELAAIGPPVDVIIIAPGEPKLAYDVCELLATNIGTIVPVGSGAAALIAKYDGEWVHRLRTNETTVGRDGHRVLVLKKEADVAKMADPEAKLAIVDPRAWVDSQPGPAGPALHVSFTLEVAAGRAPGRLEVAATHATKAIPLEDEDGKPVAALDLKAGEKRRILVRERDGTRGKAAGAVSIKAVLKRGDAELANAAVNAQVQEVR